MWRRTYGRTYVRTDVRAKTGKPHVGRPLLGPAKIYIHIKKPLFYDKRLMLNNLSLIDLQVVKVNVIHD